MKTAIPFITFCAAAGLVSTQAWATDRTDSAHSTAAQPNSYLQQASAQEFFRASDLIGKNTQDSKGTKVGEIKDVVFNQQGEIFALIDISSGKLAVVPWQAIKAQSAKGTGNVTLNATTEQLKAGPAVTKNQWGALDNPQFVQGCYAYYHIQAPSAAGGASSPGGSSQGQGQESSTNNASSQPQSHH